MANIETKKQSYYPPQWFSSVKLQPTKKDHHTFSGSRSPVRQLSGGQAGRAAPGIPSIGAPRERENHSYRGEWRPGQRPQGGPTYGCTCELRREKGNPLTPSTAQAGARFRASSPAPAPALQWRVRASWCGYWLSSGRRHWDQWPRPRAWSRRRLGRR